MLLGRAAMAAFLQVLALVSLARGADRVEELRAKIRAPLWTVDLIEVFPAESAPVRKELRILEAQPGGPLVVYTVEGRFLSRFRFFDLESRKLVREVVAEVPATFEDTFRNGRPWSTDRTVRFVSTTCCWTPGVRDGEWEFRIHDLQDGKLRFSRSGPSEVLDSPLWSPIGSRFLHTEPDGALKVHDLDTGASITLEKYLGKRPFMAEWRPDGMAIAYKRGFDDRVRLVNTDPASPEAGQLIREIGQPATTRLFGWLDSGRIVTGDATTEMTVLDVTSGKILARGPGLGQFKKLETIEGKEGRSLYEVFGVRPLETGQIKDTVPDIFTRGTPPMTVNFDDLGGGWIAHGVGREPLRGSSFSPSSMGLVAVTDEKDGIVLVVDGREIFEAEKKRLDLGEDPYFAVIQPRKDGAEVLFVLNTGQVLMFPTDRSSETKKSGG